MADGGIQDPMEKGRIEKVFRRIVLSGDLRKVLPMGVVKINAEWMTAIGLSDHAGKTGMLLVPDKLGQPFRFVIEEEEFELFNIEGPVPNHLLDKLTKERAFKIIKILEGLSISQAHNAMLEAKEMLENCVTITDEDVRTVKTRCFLGSDQSC